MYRDFHGWNYWLLQPLMLIKDSSASRTRGRWMHGRGVRLRGADWQAENMAVPFTICEESLLRVPEDDLCWLNNDIKEKEI